MSAYNTYYGITDQEVPELEEFEESYQDEIIKCNCCNEYVIDFTIHKGYVICSDCEQNQEGLSLDEIANDILKAFNGYPNEQH